MEWGQAVACPQHLRRNERGAESGAFLLHAIHVSFRVFRNICNTEISA